MPGQIEGTVTSVSATGNLVTDISSSQLENAPRDDTLTVRCDEHVTQGIFGPDHGEPDSTFLAILGENGFLELEIVGASAKIMLGIDVGEKVVLKW